MKLIFIRLIYLTGFIFTTLNTKLFRNKINGTIKMTKIFFFVFILTTVNMFSQSVLTPLQKSDYKKITSHADLSQIHKRS